MIDFLWLVPLLPFAGFVVNGLAGPRLPKSVVSAVACGAVALAFVLSVGCFLDLSALPEHHRSHTVTVAEWIGPMNLSWSFTLDPLSAVMILIVNGVGLLIHIYSIGYMWDEGGYWRYFAYLNLFMAMMLTLVLGASLPLLFVGWEGVGLCSYLLIGFFYAKVDCADAGRKAFIVNRIGDASFIIGMLLAWTTFGGTFDIGEIVARAPEVAASSPATLTLIALLLFGGACGKSAQIPLFIWLPDAMAGPTPVSALIHAATMVTAGVYMVCRMAPLYALAPGALEVVAIIGATTALASAAIAIAQDDIKKVLAYSTISQLGYMFLAAGAGAFGAAIFHLTTHAFFKALLFLGSGAVIHALHGEQDMKNMGGLKKRLPRTFWCFAAGWVAIAGVPFTSGFFSKDEILYRAWLANPGFWVAGAVGALMTAIYMTRLMGLTFWGRSRVPHEVAHHIHEAPFSMSSALAVLAALSLAGGLIGLPAAWLGHPSPFEHWLAPVFEGPEQAMSTGRHGPEMTLMLISSVAAIGGILIGFRLWVTRPELPGRIAAHAATLYRLIKGKLFVDELYEWIVLKPFYAVCRGSARFDEKAVDGTVNFVGSGLETTGHVMKLFHSGYVRNYALFYLAGAAVILWYLVGR